MTSRSEQGAPADVRPRFRGYIASRPILGSRVPQHVQNLVIRDYVSQIGGRFLLSATEYAMPNCYMILSQVLDELPSLSGIVCFSIHMLPLDRSERRAVVDRVLAAGRSLHGAQERITISTPSERDLIEDIIAIDRLSRSQAVLTGQL